VLSALQNVRTAVGVAVSLADLVVLAGGAAVEAAALAAGHPGVQVPFLGGRTDAAAFGVLESLADGFRNYDGRASAAAAGDRRAPPLAPAEVLLVEKARQLTLTKAELAVLVGGMRAMGAAHSDSNALGLLTNTPGCLDNAFFVHLLDNATVWAPVKPLPAAGDDQAANASQFALPDFGITDFFGSLAGTAADAHPPPQETALAAVFEGRDRQTGAVKWRASRCDLVFGANSELRAVAEHYACADSGPSFVADFVAAWAKVMALDRFDLQPHARRTQGAKTATRQELPLFKGGSGGGGGGGSFLPAL
jgi:catalase-peroxidase